MEQEGSDCLWYANRGRDRSLRLGRRPRPLCCRPRALVFATAGWATARATIDTPAGDADKTFNGWTVGAGVDYAFTDNLFGRAEYRYNDYGDEEIQGTDVDLDEQVVSAGVGVKF